MRSFFYGYIDEAWSGAAADGSEQRMKLLQDNDRTIERQNERVLSALPVADNWPPLVRSSFAWSPADERVVNYKGRMIHFALSLKEVDWELRDWLDKFERLLRQLYWEHAVVHFEGAYHSERFTWKPRQEWVTRLTSGILEPIGEWDFVSTMDLAKLEERRDQ